MITDTLAEERRGAHLPPSAWVERFAGRVRPGGAVLDVACGAGRHARLFLARGHPVTALDRNVSALADIAGAPGLTIVEADLETGDPWPLGEVRFAAVVVTNYLWRPRLGDIVGAVEPGGMLIYETFALGNERIGRPRNPEHLLGPGELIRAVDDDFTILAYEHDTFTEPRPAVIQRICAVRR